MKTHFEEPAPGKGLLTLTVEAADYYPELDTQIQKYRREIRLPGFRPGTVPSSLIINRFGKGLLAEALNTKINQALSEFIEAQNLKFVGRPMPMDNADEMLDPKEAKDYEFHYEFAIRPEIPLDIAAVDKLVQYEVKVSDEDYAAELERSRYRHAEATPADDAPIEADKEYQLDFFLTDVNIWDDQLPKEAPKPKFFQMLTLNTGLQPAAKQKLLGKKEGETFEIMLSDIFKDEVVSILSALGISRADYDSIAPNPVYGRIRQLGILNPQEVNEALFAKILGQPLEDGQTLDDLKAMHRQKLESDYARMADYLVHKQIQAKLLNHHQFDLAYDILEKAAIEGDEELKSVDQLYRASPEFRTNLRYSLLKERIQELEPEAKLESKAFRDALKEEFRKSYPGLDAQDEAQLAEAEETTQTLRDQVSDPYADNPEGMDVSDSEADAAFEALEQSLEEAEGQPEKMDIYDSLLLQVAQSNPKMLEEQFAAMNRTKFYDFFKSQVPVENQTVTAAEFIAAYHANEFVNPHVAL